MPSVHIDVHAPAPDLAGIIAFHQSVKTSTLPDRCETLIPAPHCSFIFQFGDGRAYRRTGGERRAYPRHLFAAPADAPVAAGSMGRTDALRVALRPHTVELVLRTPANGVRNRVLAFDECFGREGRELLERMAQMIDTASRIDAFEQWLRGRVKSGGVERLREMDYAISRMTACDSLLRIRELAAEMSVGERQLERWFLRSVGMGPKRFQRILRVNAVLREARRCESADWAALAAQFGFADQSHLVRDFAALAGATPAACLRDAGLLGAVFQGNACIVEEQRRVVARPRTVTVRRGPVRAAA